MVTDNNDNNDEDTGQHGFKEFKLKVQEARKRDIGRSIIRLDSETITELDVNTGDIIEIHGKERITSAIAWPAYPQDQGLGIVRIDSRVRKNANVGIDDFIVITKIEERATKSLAIAPVSLKIRPNTHFESFVKRKLLNFPIGKDDLVYINIGMTKEIVFRVVALKPAGISVVKQNTQLTINETSAEEVPNGIPYITYEDIGGLDREIQLIREMVELPLRHPELFKRLGIDPPKGVLLRGPPGCGKTLLAKAVANESQAHFISINGPEIMRQILWRIREKTPKFVQRSRRKESFNYFY